MIVSNPSTPVVAVAVASVPRYDFPVIATFPFDHQAGIALLAYLAVKAVLFPFNHSTTSLAPRVSASSPQVR